MVLVNLKSLRGVRKCILDNGTFNIEISVPLSFHKQHHASISIDIIPIALVLLLEKKIIVLILFM